MKNNLFAAALISLGSLGSLTCLAACSKTKIKECEDFVRTAEKIEKCEKLPASSREDMKQGIKQIKDALKVIEDVGDQAPKEQLEMLGRTCKSQHDTILRLYEKSAPECLK